MKNVNLNKVLKCVFEICLIDKHIINIINNYIYERIVKYYSENPNIKLFEYTTKHGKKDGLCTKWMYSSLNKDYGVLSSVEQFTFKNDILNGLYSSFTISDLTFFFDSFDQSYLVELEEVNYLNGLKDGLLIRYNIKLDREIPHKDITFEQLKQSNHFCIVEKTEYKNGLKNGLSRKWHTNFDKKQDLVLKYRGIFIDNKENGLHESWWKDGTPKGKEYYKNGRYYSSY